MSRGTVGERTVEWLNGLPEAEAAAELRACCSADAWVDAVVAARPYAFREALLQTSRAAVAALDDGGLAQALAAHARIGRSPDGPGGDGPDDERSRREQAGALAADPALAAALAQGNRDYEARFGRVFLVRAAGRSGQELYDALRTRLGNDDATERTVVLHELAAITELRLTDLVHPRCACPPTSSTAPAANRPWASSSGGSTSSTSTGDGSRRPPPAPTAGSPTGAGRPPSRAPTGWCSAAGSTSPPGVSRRSTPRSWSSSRSPTGRDTTTSRCC